MVTLHFTKDTSEILRSQSATNHSRHVGWLYGVLLTTLNDADIPAITTANGDGIFALENLKAEFANAGLGEQQLDWKIEDELNTPYDSNKVMYSVFMAAFTKSVTQMDRLYPNRYDNKRKLSLLCKNLRLISSSVLYLFDKIDIDQTHWLQAIRFLQLKLPGSIKSGTTTGNHLMAPNHMNHTLAIPANNNDQNHLTYCSSFANYAELNQVAGEVLNVYYTNFTADRNPDPQLKAYKHTKRAFSKPGTNC